MSSHDTPEMLQYDSINFVHDDVLCTNTVLSVELQARTLETGGVKDISRLAYGQTFLE